MCILVYTDEVHPSSRVKCLVLVTCAWMDVDEQSEMGLASVGALSIDDPLRFQAHYWN